MGSAYQRPAQEVFPIIWILSDWDRVSSALQHGWQSNRCPRSAPSGRRRSQALRMPQASVPSSPRSLPTRSGSGVSRISGSANDSRPTLTPAAGLRPAGTRSRRFPRSFPRGDRLQKRSLSLGCTSAGRGFQFGSGLGTCGLRPERKNELFSSPFLIRNLLSRYPEEITRVERVRYPELENAKAPVRRRVALGR